jgi:hypothetical protein
MTLIQVTYYGLPVQPVPFDIKAVEYGEVKLARRGWGAMRIGCSSAGHLGSMDEVEKAAAEEDADVEFLGWAYLVKNLIGGGTKFAWAMRDGTLSHDLHAESVHAHFQDALMGLMAAYQSPQSHGIRLVRDSDNRLRKLG